MFINFYGYAGIGSQALLRTKWYHPYKFKSYYPYSYIKKNFLGGYSSIGRTTICGIVSSLFNSRYPPYMPE